MFSARQVTRVSRTGPRLAGDITWLPPAIRNNATTWIVVAMIV